VGIPSFRGDRESGLAPLSIAAALKPPRVKTRCLQNLESVNGEGREFRVAFEGIAVGTSAAFGFVGSRFIEGVTVMGRVVDLKPDSTMKNETPSRVCPAPCRTTQKDQVKWDAGTAMLVIVGAEMKCVALFFRFAMDFGAAWLDASHQIAVQWRAR
jgi:hypothetical protein